MPVGSSVACRLDASPDQEKELGGVKRKASPGSDLVFGFQSTNKRKGFAEDASRGVSDGLYCGEENGEENGTGVESVAVFLPLA